MTKENPETIHVVTDVPPAPKAKRRFSLPKKSDAVQTDATETETAPKRSFGPHGIYLAGALLVAGGVVGAVASKLGAKSHDSDSDVPTDTPTTDN